MCYVIGLKWESRCLFSCLHLDKISDFLFKRVFCEGWVMIESFSCRQRRQFLEDLLYAGAIFSIFHVMDGEMFMSFCCQMYVDREVLFE